MNRNKIVYVLVTFIVAIVFCATSVRAASTFISIGTGSTGGTFYPVGVILANVFNQELQSKGYKFTAQASGGTTENLEMIRNKEIKMGICGSVPTANAYQGIDKYKGKEIKHLRYVTALWPEAVQLMYRKDSGIRTLGDFKGKKIAVGPAGGGGVFYLPIILKEYNGMTFKDFNVQYLGYGDSVQALQNRLIHACYLAAGLPTSAVSQIYAGQAEADMIQFSDDEINRISKAAPFFTKIIIPKDTYPKQDKPLQTVAIKSALVCDQDVEDGIIYAMLDALYVKHNEEVRKQHGSLRLVTLNEAVKGLTGAPLHPGAVKFYRDKGLSVPDSLIPSGMK